MKTKFKVSAKQIGLDLINQNMLKHRKQGGAKRALDNYFETAIAKAIEEKSVAHGRRHDLVLYCNRRGNARDLLGIANSYLRQRGKRNKVTCYFI